MEQQRRASDNNFEGSPTMGEDNPFILAEKKMQMQGLFVPKSEEEVQDIIGIITKMEQRLLDDMIKGSPTVGENNSFISTEKNIQKKMEQLLFYRHG